MESEREFYIRKINELLKACSLRDIKRIYAAVIAFLT